MSKARPGHQHEHANALGILSMKEAGHSEAYQVNAQSQTGLLLRVSCVQLEEVNHLSFRCGMASKLPWICWNLFWRQSRGLSGMQHQVSHTSHTQNCSGPGCSGPGWAPWLGAAGGAVAAVLSPAHCEESGTQERTPWSWVREHIDPRHLLGQHARPESQSATQKYFSDELRREPQVNFSPVAG